MGKLQGQFWASTPLYRAWGFRNTIPVTTPAAGKEWEWKPTPGFLYRPLLIFSTFTTSAEAGERIPGYEVLDQTGRKVGQVAATVSAVVNAVHSVTWSATWTALSTRGGGIYGGHLLPVIAASGWVIKSNTSALQAADTYTNVSVYAEAYEPDAEHDIEHLREAVEHLHHIRKALSHDEQSRSTY